MKKNIITAVDIGSTMINVYIAEVIQGYKLKITGKGFAKSVGFKNGRIDDITKAAFSIKKAINIAEGFAKYKAANLYVGISGSFIKSETSYGNATLIEDNDKGPKEITHEDINKVINNAKSICETTSGNENYKMIHAIPQYFYIGLEDAENKRISNPHKMTGYNLNANVHVVLADATQLKYIEKCFSEINKSIKEIVYKPIATAKAVLNQDERKIGSILLDIGGNNLETAIFFGNSIRFSKNLAHGGEEITRDISYGLRINFEEAERVKSQYGIMNSNFLKKKTSVTCKSLGGNEEISCDLSVINQIIKEAVKDMVTDAYNELKENEIFELVTAGIVLTGGTALLSNISPIVESIFRTPVRIGSADLKNIEKHSEDLLDPRKAASIGLLYIGLDKLIDNGVKIKTDKKPAKNGFIENFKKIMKILKEYV